MQFGLDGIGRDQLVDETKLASSGEVRLDEAGSVGAIVQSADSSSLINIILYGAHPDSRLPAPFGAWESMKGFQDKLSDDEVAALASYIRGEWGHQASTVEADEVQRQR